MALSSWNLLHAYTGDEALVADMRLMADYWLAHGLSPSAGAWALMPFPYNLQPHSGRYDGDMRAGPGVLQPDKAGSFGAELLTLYEITGDRRYLDAAKHIAETLASTVREGDEQRSPWPFRVDAATGATATVRPGFGRYDDGRSPPLATEYTANWTGTLRLFDGLASIGVKTGQIARARALTRNWLLHVPLVTNNWGPFFEDIVETSNTAINADTMAQYLLDHPEVPERRGRRATDSRLGRADVRQPELRRARCRADQRADHVPAAGEQPHGTSRLGGAALRRANGRLVEERDAGAPAELGDLYGGR